MNRAHNANEAEQCLAVATQHFSNISADLIYGIPGMSDSEWRSNISKLLKYKIKHISSYALTVEPKTVLEKLISKGKMTSPNDELAEQHFVSLVDILESNGYIHYELSNFGKFGYFSKHNSSYWQGKPYLGIGPSAHSFFGSKRSWNVSNNTKYIKSISDKKLPSDFEILSKKDQYNEYIMTGLRTFFGVSLDYIEDNFGSSFKNQLIKRSAKFIENGLLEQSNLIIDGPVIRTTKKGKFLCDGIAADLFLTT